MSDDGYFTDMRRVETEHGDYLEPALGQDWPMLTKLEWQLAVLRVDTGIIMTVQPGNHWINGVKLLDQFSYSAMNHGWSSRGFHGSWDFINGVSTGATLAKEQGARRETAPTPCWTQPDWTGPTTLRRIPEVSDGRKPLTDRINDMKAELRSITDSRGYRAQDITVLSDEPVTSYE